MSTHRTRNDVTENQENPSNLLRHIQKHLNSEKDDTEQDPSQLNPTRDPTRTDPPPVCHGLSSEGCCLSRLDLKHRDRALVVSFNEEEGAMNLLEE